MIVKQKEGRLIASPETLPGVQKKSFSLYYGGGEIWIEHLDGLYEYAELALAKLEKDSLSFGRPSMPSLIAINVDETTLTDTLIRAIVQKLRDGSKRFTRVVFVGANKAAKRELRTALSSAPLALAFIDDFEKAKEWLVPKGA